MCTLNYRRSGNGIFSLSEDHSAGPIGQHTVSNVQLDRPRQHGFFQISADFDQPFGIHGMVHASHILFDDPSFLELCGNVMGCCPDDFDPPCKGLVLGSSAFETR